MSTKNDRNDVLMSRGEQTMELTWSMWYPLKSEQIRYIVPEEYGIYKLRQADGKTVPRFVGQSEMLYIGRSGTSRTRTLRRRLLELVRGQHVAWPRVKRIREELKLGLEYCFAITQKPDSYEKLMLMLYEKEHFELPPLNHVGGL